MMVDHELDALKKEFLEEAAGKVGEIESTLTLERNSESLDRLAYLAHQLKGSGGSYGYQRISEDAAEIEKAVESVTSGGAGDGLDERVRNHVTALRNEIEQRLSEL
jgi:HPt (histidine-containing phosphotransfer) domain-containing protein